MITKIRSIFSLGLLNAARVASYRLSVKFSLHPVRRIHAQLAVDQIFFMPPSFCYEQNAIHIDENDVVRYFGWYKIDQQRVPNWHKNPFTGTSVQNATTQPWWMIPDFDSQLGDIKIIWELSRFNWVLRFAQLAVQGKKNAIDQLNCWLSDWCVHNPAYYGPNWKCGQEASIRVMHLAIAALLLQQHEKISNALHMLVKSHLQRIAPTIQYAIAQDNNHGTSEAAALFIGGSWLNLIGDEKGATWAAAGRKWLENRAARLIENDGSFSQYSVNYHRVMLDTYSMVEYWRSRLNLPKFSIKLYQQLTKAVDWLYQLVHQKTGDAPNIGANDGAMLFPLSSAEYRDFRPSVQIAMVLFCKKNAYLGTGSWNDALRWLNIQIPEQTASPQASMQFSQGGYSLLRKEKKFAVLRVPNFRFRPSQADALHVDFWLNEHNLLCDGGSYSYNSSDDSIMQYFSGTASHNTIQFDDRDQMPRISRFLFGNWLKAENVCPVYEQEDSIQTAAGYSDYQDCYHHRTVKLFSDRLHIKDIISNFKRKAVLRWRLNSDKYKWIIEKTSCTNGQQRLSICSTTPIRRFEIISGWKSTYYMKKKVIPVLEVEVDQSCEINTILYFNT